MALTLRGNGQITSDNYTVDSDGAVTATSATVSGNVTVDTNTLYVDAANNRVGIGEASPDRVLHVKSGTTNTGAKFESTDATTSIEFADNAGTAEIGATGNDLVIFPAGYEKFRVSNNSTFKHVDNTYASFSGTIHSSETRWYKLINYANGFMFDGMININMNRNGGFNQTGGHRMYNGSIGGYSNAIYGPFNATGNSGDGGNGEIVLGNDNALYLKTHNSIYGGGVNGFIVGKVRSWDYDGTYVTSQP